MPLRDSRSFAIVRNHAAPVAAAALVSMATVGSARKGSRAGRGMINLRFFTSPDLCSPRLQ
jgi:hypothetical protein